MDGQNPAWEFFRNNYFGRSGQIWTFIGRIRSNLPENLSVQGSLSSLAARSLNDWRKLRPTYRVTSKRLSQAFVGTKLFGKDWVNQRSSYSYIGTG